MRRKSRRRERDEGRGQGWIAGRFGTRDGGWRLKGWRRVVARKRGSVIVPLLPFPLPLTPTSIHAHTRAQPAHAPAKGSPTRVARTLERIYVRTRGRIFTLTRENRRYVLSDTVTRTRNLRAQPADVSTVVSTYHLVDNAYEIPG